MVNTGFSIGLPRACGGNSSMIREISNHRRAAMKRMHLHISVPDIDQAIR
jgi:hypothetical protein